MDPTGRQGKEAAQQDPLPAQDLQHTRRRQRRDVHRYGALSLRDR